jgi:hypothetical protein
VTTRLSKEARNCWALRNPQTRETSLVLVRDTEDEIRQLLKAQRLHQPHSKFTEPVEVVITIAAKPVGR